MAREEGKRAKRARRRRQWGMRASRAQHSTYRKCRRRASKDSDSPSSPKPSPIMSSSMGVVGAQKAVNETERERVRRRQWGMRASRAQHSTYRECRRRASAGGVNHQSWWPQRPAKPPRQRQAPSVWLQQGAQGAKPRPPLRREGLRLSIDTLKLLRARLCKL